MFSSISALLLMFLFFNYFYGSNCSTCPTVCQWTPWYDWTACSVQCGGGTQTRTRELCCPIPIDVTSCLANCGLKLAGFDDSQQCNNICYYGTFNGAGCTCNDGCYGPCCENIVNCGDPGTIPNGYVTGANYNYGQTVTYTCNSNYLLVGQATSTCINAYGSNTVGVWSGTKPYCAFINSCGSNPCQHGTCTNQPDAYKCTCPSDWTGINCEIDIQPPVVSGCDANTTQYTSRRLDVLSWNVPIFTDPHGGNVIVTSNYQSNSVTEPWGEYVIQYTATKPSNGMWTECVFSRNLYPHPCPPLPAPVRGALACNGWNSRFGEVCAVMCQQDWDLPLTADITELYVCGAIGQWIGPNHVPDPCSEPRTQPVSVSTTNHYYSGVCVGDNADVRTNFVAFLHSSTSRFQLLCTSKRWAPLCTPASVNVKCGPGQ